MEKEIIINLDLPLELIGISGNGISGNGRNLQEFNFEIKEVLSLINDEFGNIAKTTEAK